MKKLKKKWVQIQQRHALEYNLKSCFIATQESGLRSGRTCVLVQKLKIKEDKPEIATMYLQHDPSIIVYGVEYTRVRMQA